ncbi:MAG: hypothetical protein ACRER5_03065 [Pseudomonas sp.]
MSDLVTRIREIEVQAHKWNTATDRETFLNKFEHASDPVIAEARLISDDCVDTVHAMLDEILIELGHLDASERQT